MSFGFKLLCKHHVLTFLLLSQQKPCPTCFSVLPVWSSYPLTALDIYYSIKVFTLAVHIYSSWYAERVNKKYCLVLTSYYSVEPLVEVRRLRGLSPALIYGHPFENIGEL